MKRFIGYITLCATMIIGLGIGFLPTVSGLNGSADYSSSKEFVFKVSDRVTEDGAFDGTTTNTELSNDSSAINDIISTFETRLNAIQISNYKINKIGDDTISVIYRTNDNFYDDITDYLTFSWSFMASTYGDTPVSIGNSASSIKTNGNKTNEFFMPGSATIEYKDSYPYVVVELSDNGEKFKTLYEKAKADDSTNTDDLNHNRLDADDDSEETETAAENKIYILNDWIEGLSIKDYVDNKETDNLAKDQYYKHVLFEFDATDPSSFFWDWDSSDASKEDNYKKIYFGGYEIDGSKSEGGNYGTTSTTQSNAYMKSLIWCNIFNSSSYEYEITLLNSTYVNSTMNNSVSPIYEYLVFMNNVEFSSLLIATLCGIALLLLVYLLNFGINGLGGTIATVGTGIITLALFNVLGVEFNIGAIIGIVAVTFISLFTSMALFYKTKKEIYSGKNFKKAYQDGGKKAFWIALDGSVVGILAGFVAYLIPINAISSFGIYLIIGSVINLIVVGLILRGMSWFVYNSKFVADRPKLLSLDKKLIPDLTKDEAPKYFESFKYKTNKKTVLTTSIVSGVITVASIAAMIVFSSINGSVLNTPSNEQSSQVYITQVLPSSSSNKTEDYVTEFKQNFDLHFAKDESGTKLIKNLDVDYYYFTYKLGKTTKYEVTYMITLDGSYDETTSKVYYRSDAQSGKFEETNVQEAFASYAEYVVGMNNVNSESISVKKVYEIENSSYINYTLMYVGIALSLIFIYFLIRYGLNRAIVSLLLNAALSFTTLGIFSLIHVSVSAVIALGILLIVVFNSLIFTTFFVGEKEKWKENRKLFKTDLAARYECYEYTNNVDYAFIKYTSLICGFPVISLLFASSVNKMLVILIFVGMIIALPVIKNLTLSSEKALNKGFTHLTKNIKFSKKEKKNKSSENEGPEEATFTGIND